MSLEHGNVCVAEVWQRLSDILMECSGVMLTFLFCHQMKKGSREGRKCSMGDSKGVISPLSEGQEHQGYCALVKKWLIHGKTQLGKVLN